MQPTPLLSVRDLAVEIDGTSVLKNVSFDIAPQEVLAIVGPNGAGKSVLLKTLLGFFRPSGGSISFAPGTRIGYLPQRFHVDSYLPMTALEFLELKRAMPTRLAEVPAKQAGRQALARAIEQTEISPKLLVTPLAYLSSGQLQKVLLAWALMNEPNLLFFDEPTENVDVVGQESVYSLLHHLQDHLGIALIIISHDLHVVYRYANHVLCLNHTMTCYGEPQTALTSAALSELYGDHAFFHHHHFNEKL
ncbi:MAG: metal ABC transporter ATP-binding protein [bacterium]|nr:metal ABC transporter ATP-binding protein [bacterium]